MSGRKYVSVDSYELSSLRQDASRLRALRHDIPDLIESAVSQNRYELNARLSPIETRQREFAKAVKNLGAGIQQVEQDMATRIEEQARRTRKTINDTNKLMESHRRELRQALNDTAQKLEDTNRQTREQLQKEIQASEKRMQQLNLETRKIMHQQEERLSQAISAERQQREHQFQNLQHEIIAIHADRQRLASIAQSWLESAQTMMDFIDGHYRHKQFTPGQLERLARAVQIARENLNQDAPEAALGAAQNAYQDLSNLRLDLEKLEIEWNIWREQAISTARLLLAQAQSNRHLSRLEQSGEVAEVNYWTNGKLALLEDEINQTINRAGDESSPLSIDELRRLVEQTLPEYDNRLDDILVEAEIAMRSSQVRVNIADLAMQALLEQGFSVQNGATYEGEDMRGGFVAKATNRDGTEVIISVVPDGERNRLEVNSFEKRTRSPGELLQRSQEIAKSMAQKNIDFRVSDPKTFSEIPDESVRDLEQVRKRRPVSKSQNMTV